MNDDSKLDFYLNIGDIDLVSELVGGVLTNLNYEATHPGNETSIYEWQNTVRFVFYSLVRSQMSHTLGTCSKPDFSVQNVSNIVTVLCKRYDERGSMYL